MKTELSICYEAPSQERWHPKSQVTLIDLSKPAPPVNKGFGLLGFACDSGIIRNHGRPGAYYGPTALRQAMLRSPIYDCGDIICKNHDLESAQHALAEAVKSICQLNLTPILIGGGHEMAYGHFLGLSVFHSNIGIINIDAHYDLRPLLSGNKGSSGTPFLQIAQHCKNNNKDFHYCVLGIQPESANKEIMENVRKLNVLSFTAKQIQHNNIQDELKTFMLSCNQIYLTICLDAFSKDIAPGVSSPQALGISLDDILPHLKIILDSKKVCAMDIAELSPPLDEKNKTTQLAVSLCDFILPHIIP